MRHTWKAGTPLLHNPRIPPRLPRRSRYYVTHLLSTDGRALAAEFPNHQLGKVRHTWKTNTPRLYNLRIPLRYTRCSCYYAMQLLSTNGSTPVTNTPTCQNRNCATLQKPLRHTEKCTPPTLQLFATLVALERTRYQPAKFGICATPSKTAAPHKQNPPQQPFPLLRVIRASRTRPTLFWNIK